VQSLNGTEDGGLRIEDRSDTAFQSSILNPQSSTRFLAVRFGNVLVPPAAWFPSSASRSTRRASHRHASGHEAIFHDDPEASQLVMQAGAIGKGGEIFVLDMGEPVKILDLALQMIRRSGLKAEKTSRFTTPAFVPVRSCTKSSRGR